MRMKSWFGLLRSTVPPAAPVGAPEHRLRSTQQRGRDADDAVMVSWETRALEIGARSIPVLPAAASLKALWARDRHMGRMDAREIERLQRFLHFVAVPAGCEVIRQHEYGNFMVVLLKGSIAVDRRQPWGEHLRLAESRPGDILGEMSLLDNGTRFSACSTLVACEIAALSAEAMDAMMHEEPRVAAAISALLARKLSLRLRAVSERLSDRPNLEHVHGTRAGQ